MNRSHLAFLCLACSLGFAGLGCSALTQPTFEDIRPEPVAMAKAAAAAPALEGKVANAGPPMGVPNAPPVPQGAAPKGG